MTTQLTQIPKDIREYFGSEEISTKLREISAKADLVIPRTLPRLIYLLETKEVSTHDLIDYIIREIKLPIEKARALAKEIKEKILEPKRYSLTQWGIDISFIDVAGASPLDAFPPLVTEGVNEVTIPEIKSKEKTIPLESLSFPQEEKVEIKSFDRTQDKPFGTAQGRPLETAPIFATPKELAENKPLIIHEESSILKTKEKRPNFKGFSLPSVLFKNRREEAPREVMAKIEVPENKPTNITRGKLFGTTEDKKVIHYSEFRTSVSPFEENGGFIKPFGTAQDKPLDSTQGKPSETKMTEPAKENSFKIPETAKDKIPPQNFSAEPQKNFIVSNIEKKQINPTGPKLEGNKVDLRQAANNL